MKLRGKTIFQPVLLLLILSLPLAAGCGHALRVLVHVVESEDLGPVDPKGAYIVMGQKLGAGNLTRMAVSIHVNGRPLDIKGIQFRGRGGEAQFWGSKYTDLKLVGADGHGYRVWPVPPEQFEGGGRALAFVQMVGSEETTFAPRYPFGRSACFHCAPVAPVDILRKDDEMEMLFRAWPFVIDRPGVYYLGEVAVDSDVILKTQDGARYAAISQSPMSFSTQPEEARRFAGQLGLSGLEFRDFSAAFHPLPSFTLGDYLSGSPRMEYFRP